MGPFLFFYFFYFLHNELKSRAHLEVDRCLLVVHFPVVAGRALLRAAVPGSRAGGIVDNVVAASICIGTTGEKAIYN